MSVSSPLPKHIALIMDGNGRWAKKRMLPRVAGHKFAVNRVRDIVRVCAEKGIEALTLFAFSSENWQRPKEEVGILMNLAMHTIETEVQKMHANGIQLKFIGDIEKLDANLQQVFQDAEKLTANNPGLKLRIAFNYGGHWDITQAVQKLAVLVQQGKLKPEAITEEAIAANLSTQDLPLPDLFIRTSGEQRISNFLLWQLAYSELYFTDTLFPDFDEQALEKALHWFAQRERRFGKISEQLG
jgi:undecaprenyl diphosphate synthase